jgi:type II secretory pathway pseudopilin PulG
MIRSGTGRRGLSMLEVLVALGILTAGILSIMAIFPATLKAQRESELLSLAANLAQMKAEEIRKDDSSLVNPASNNPGKLLIDIRAMTDPSAPMVFPNEPRLAYSYCGQTLLYKDLDPTDPRAEPGVARVIIRYAPSFRASQDVIYELRFQ